MATFTETQRLGQGWFWLLLGAVVIATASPLRATTAQSEPSTWIGAVIGLLIMWIVVKPGI